MILTLTDSNLAKNISNLKIKLFCNARRDADDLKAIVKLEGSETEQQAIQIEETNRR